MVNKIIVRSILSISSIHEFPSISIEYLLYFTQAELDVDVFRDITLGMGVYRNRGYWVLKLNKSIYSLKQASSNCFDLINTGLLHILRNIQEKTQATSWVSTQIIITTRSRCCSEYHMYKKSWPAREILSLKWLNIQMKREKGDQTCLRLLIQHQLVSGYLPGWPIKPNKHMVYLLNGHYQ